MLNLLWHPLYTGKPARYDIHMTDSYENHSKRASCGSIQYYALSCDLGFMSKSYQSFHMKIIYENCMICIIWLWYDLLLVWFSYQFSYDFHIKGASYESHIWQVCLYICFVLGSFKLVKICCRLDIYHISILFDMCKFAFIYWLLSELQRWPV